MIADMRLGRWQDVLSDVECDTWISDAPWGEDTHSRRDRAARVGLRGDGRSYSGIGYDHLTPDDVREIVGHWSPRTRGWFVTMTDHNLAPVWADALEAAGRFVFPWVVFVDPLMSARLRGDGPSNWTTRIIAARPRSDDWSKWGTLPGAYTRNQGDKVHDPQGGKIRGGKPVGVMRRIVRDYTTPGDKFTAAWPAHPVVCDPFAGHGTTLLAASLEGRQVIGAEVDSRSHAIAVDRLASTPAAPGKDGTLSLFG